jgi:WD40 repeat protein
MSDRHDESSAQEERLHEVLAAYLEAERAGQAPERAVLLARHPDLAAGLQSFFADRDHFQHRAGPPAAAAVTLAPREAAACSPPGTHVRYFGDYELQGEIARGGMGVVYRARQVSLNRLVALKMILAGHLASVVEVQRFRTEAEAAASLDHPNIVPIYEVGEYEGQHYFSMKLIHQEAAVRGPKSATTNDQRQAVRLVATVARAVHYAHQRGIIHRDLKPANILIDGQGQPHVTDFGLAKRVAGDSNLSQSGAIVGTPAYMAPEQAAGKKGLTTAADVYSLGAILYELLAGTPPFVGATPLDVVLQVLEKEPTPLRQIQPGIHRDLETICLKCLQKDPQKRYGTAEELADDLQRFQTGEPIRARPAGLAERSVKWVRRRPLVAALLAAVFLVAVLGVAAFAWAFDQALEARDDAVTEKDRTAQALLDTEKARNKAQEEKRTADRARQQAEREKKQKEKQLSRAEHLLYISHITEAHHHLLNHDLGPCRLALDECRWDLRGPEFGYLANQLQRKARLLHGHTGSIVSLALSADGKRLFSGSSNPDHAIKGWDLVRRAGGREPPVCTLTLHGHSETISDLILSLDGKRLFWGSEDRTIKVWDLEGGNEVLSLPGHKGNITSLALSRDGKRLVSGDGNSSINETFIAGGTIKVWDLETGKETLTLAGHASPIRSLVLSGDGKRLFSASEDDKTIRIWDLETGKEALALRGHASGVYSLALSGDGKRLFSGSADHTIKVWDVAAGKETLTLRGHPSPVNSLVLSRDGQRLFSASWDGVIKGWYLEAGKEILTLRGQWAVNRLALAADGKRLFSGGSDGTIEVWDLDTTREMPIQPDAAAIHTLRGYKGSVSCALSADGKRLASVHTIVEYDELQDVIIRVWDLTAGREIFSLRGKIYWNCKPALSGDGKRLFVGMAGDIIEVWEVASGKKALTLSGHYSLLVLSGDGKRLFSQSQDHTIKVWEVAGKEVLTLRGHVDEVLGAALSRDGKRLATASYSGAIKVWDLETGKETHSLRGHKDGAYTLGLSADGQRLFSTGADKTIKIWDLEAGKETLILPAESSQLALSADGQRLFFLGRNNTIQGWDLEVRKETRTLRGHSSGVSSLILSADGKRLFSGSWDSTIKGWDLTTGQETFTLRGHAKLVTSLALSRDGKRLFSAGGTFDITGAAVSTIKVWDLETGQETLSLRGHKGMVACLAVSGDGKRLISGAGVHEAGKQEGTIKVWDLQTGKEIRTLIGHMMPVTGLVLSGDGKRLFSASADGTIKEWDLESGTAIRTLFSSAGSVLCLVLSRDGKQLVSGHEDRTIKVWDLEAGKVIHTLRGHTAPVGSLALSSDGQRLFSGGQENTIKVWDLATGKEIRTLYGHKYAVNSLVLSGDGQRLLSGSQDHTIKVWELEPAK